MQMRQSVMVACMQMFLNKLSAAFNPPRPQKKENYKFQEQCLLLQLFKAGCEESNMNDFLATLSTSKAKVKTLEVGSTNRALLAHEL